MSLRHWLGKASQVPSSSAKHVWWFVGFPVGFMWRKSFMSVNKYATDETTRGGYNKNQEWVKFCIPVKTSAAVFIDVWKVTVLDWMLRVWLQDGGLPGAWNLRLVLEFCFRCTWNQRKIKYYRFKEKQKSKLPNIQGLKLEQRVEAALGHSFKSQEIITFQWISWRCFFVFFFIWIECLYVII